MEVYLVKAIEAGWHANLKPEKQLIEWLMKLLLLLKNINRISVRNKDKTAIETRVCCIYKRMMAIFIKTSQRWKKLSFNWTRSLIIIGLRITILERITEKFIFHLETEIDA